MSSSNTEPSEKLAQLVVEELDIIFHLQKI